MGEKKGKLFLVSVVMVYAISAITYFINSSYNEKIQNSKGAVFAGNETCKSYHTAIYDSFALTSHFNDSHLPSDEMVKGSFEQDHNYILFNADFKNIVVMEKHKNEFF